MVTLTEGDIFDSGAEALVNPVNCAGVMGAGLARYFRERFPENFHIYVQACRRRELTPGRLLVVGVSACQMPRYIINFPTKRHWRDLSRLEDIESGLCHLVQIVHDRQIASLAVPALGYGLGGLEWETVHSRILHALSPLTGVNILVFPPAPDRQRRDGPVVSDRKPGGGADRFHFSLFR